jgi:hypothetical protein
MGYRLDKKLGIPQATSGDYHATTRAILEHF